MEHVAIDLGRPNSVMSEFMVDGRKKHRTFRLDRDNLTHLFRDRAHSRVLIEASTESEWVARHIEDLGHEVVVADPNYAPMYAKRNRRVKTDVRDADALLEANRHGIYRPAYRRSQEQADVLAVQRVHQSLVRTRTRWINVIRAQLRRAGHRVRSGEAESFVHRVEELNLHEELHELIRPLLELLSPLNEQLIELERRTARASRDNPQARLLQTAPGVGAVTSVSFLAVIDDVSRFPNGHHVGSYLGLVPGEWSSSERRIRLGITKQGDTYLRWLLVEAGWRIMRSKKPECQELRRWALKIAERRGKNKAAVALARRLAGILFAMLRDNTPFQASRIAGLQRTAA